MQYSFQMLSLFCRVVLEGNCIRVCCTAQCPDWIVPRHSLLPILLVAVNAMLQPASIRQTPDSENRCLQVCWRNLWCIQSPAPTAVTVHKGKELHILYPAHQVQLFLVCFFISVCKFPTSTITELCVLLCSICSETSHQQETVWGQFGGGGGVFQIQFLLMRK